MQVTFEHSPLWLLLIIPIGAVIGWWIYWYRNDYSEWTKGLKGIATGLRISTLIVVALILLEPFIIQIINEVEKPKLLIYQDVSASIDSTENATLTQLIQANESSLSEQFDIKYHQFGSHVFDEPMAGSDDQLQTDYAGVMESIEVDYYNQNIGAVVVATDGVQTTGKDPKYSSYNTGAPLLTLALGDTAQKADLEVSELLSNDLAFLGNDFQIKARLNAQRLKGKEVKLQLKSGNTVLQTQKLIVNSDKASLERIFKLEASAVGLTKYTVELVPVVEEENTINNAQDIFVEVLDNRTQVLILGKNAHPDIAAFKASIASIDQYEVETALIETWDENVENVDLVILHGLPTGPNDLNKIKAFRDKRVPTMSVFTPEISLLHFKQMKLGLNLGSVRKSTDEAGGYIHDGFNLFSTSKNDVLQRYPPLRCLFGEYQLTVDGQTLLKQRIGPVETEKPLLAFTGAEGWKRAFLLGEGWWKWRLYERMKFDENWTDQVMIKTVQYLALKQKRTRLRVEAPRKVNQGSEITFEAEYYNESYELVNGGNVELSVTDSLGRIFDYKFKPVGRGYVLNLGGMGPGSYQWVAKTQSEGVVFTEAGEFIVSENRAEFVQSTADHAFLQQWSSAFNGQTFSADNASGLMSFLSQVDSAKPIIHSSTEWKSIIKWKWIAFFVVLLIAVEWFIRKFNGYY